MRLLLLSFLIASLSFAQQSSFTVNPTVACVGAPVNYFGQSTPGFTVLSWNWNFGDGNSSTQQNPVHIYSLPGPKTITLTIQYEGVSPSPFSQQVIQVNPKPNAAFTANVSGCTLPVSVSFSNSSSGGVSQLWTFGNGNTSTAVSPPTQSYGTPGTANPTLIVTNSFGCTDTASQAIVINNFFADINAPATACRGIATTFNDNSSANADSWSWSCPQAIPTNSTLENPTFTFVNPGTYTITLTAGNSSSGCSATTTQQITVLPSPVPSFTANPPTGCAPETITFTNTSPPGTNFTWNFGDGTTASGQTIPDHIYTTNGTFYPSLIMTDNNGCIGVYVGSPIELGVPSAGFMVSQMAGCTPLTVQFSDTSSYTAPITSWLWDFGNGNTSTQQNPTEIFELGIYDITLTITSGGCTSTISYNDLIMVGDTFDVTFDVFQPDLCATSLVTLTSTTDVSPWDDQVNYIWYPCKTGPSVQVPMPGSGEQEVYLSVVFRGCLSESEHDTLQVNGPRGRFVIPITACNLELPADLPFTDGSSMGELSDDVDMVWYWDDGSVPEVLDDVDLEDANQGSITHNYTDYGTYHISQVTHNYTTGCQDSVVLTIELGKTTPVITLTTNDSLCDNSVFLANGNGSSTNYENGVYYQYWHLPDSTIDADTSASGVALTFPHTGSFVVELVVGTQHELLYEFMDCSPASGTSTCEASLLQTFVVLDAPVADFIADDTIGCSPFVVTFTNASDDDGNGVMPTSFEFTFPDGTQTTSSISTPVIHTFTGTGIFDVSMIATDPYGCQSQPTHDTIIITKPVAAFSMAESVVCELDSLLAVNTSQNVVSWAWELDGTPNGSPDSLHLVFNEANDTITTHFDHLLQLIVADSNGCTDTIVQPIIVSTPIALLDYLLDGASTNENGVYTCPPVFAEFTNESLTYGEIESYSWTFGDGNTSIEEDPDNTYVFAGTYSATFAFIDEYGCPADTTLIDFLTIGGPQAHPLWTQDIDTCARVIHFDLGPGSVGVAGVTWNLNDGNVVMDSLTFDHLYTEGHTYNASATIVDTDGCQVFYPLPPIVIPIVDINAYFTYSPSSIDLGQEVVFTDQSTSAAPIASWSWDLSNIPVFSNDGSPVSNQYFIAGTYPIELAIEDVFGCVDTFMLYIAVDPDFEVPNVFTSNGDGVNDVFSMPYDLFDHFDIVIVNRWGNTIRESLGVTGTIIWDGRTDEGEMCSPGVYFYIIKGVLKNGTPFDKQGFLELFTGK